MKISCADAGKRFNRDWIFRHFNYEFTPGQSYAITGPNGSGKSTLLQVLAGAIVSSEGKVSYKAGEREIDNENAFTKLSIAAPYLDVIEEMTLLEFFNFHQIFKPFSAGIEVPEIITMLGLQKAANKQIRFYSSGMKQRVKLAQAIFSDTPCLLLDEPCTNLDLPGVELYHQLINQFCANRLVVISSNDKQEYSFCGNVVSILDFK